MLEKKAELLHTIGNAVTKYRQSLGLTQAQLAEILGVGNDAVSRLERGVTVPTMLRLLELSEIFGCDVADLLTEGSARTVDQARYLESLLAKLSMQDRTELLKMIEQLVRWKLATTDQAKV